MERIIAAAYLVKPEFIMKGTIYQTGRKVPDDIFRCRIGRHHAEILHLWSKQVDNHTDGFYTSYGRYVDRKEAARIALACGQITKLHYWRNELDSSDIFDYDENDIEYIREGAFIEKAKKWFEKHNEWFDPNGVRHCDLEDFEDFRKAMKGE